MRRAERLFRTKDGALRAGWLLALGAVVTAGLVRTAQSMAALATGVMLAPLAIYGNSASVQNMSAGIARWAGCIAMGAGATISWHYFTKKPLAQMGLCAEKAGARKLCHGALQGAAAALAAFGVLLAAAQVRIEVPVPAFHGAVVERALFYGLAALAEGLFYQGFCLHAAMPAKKSRAGALRAVLVAAALYTVGHMAAGVPVWWHGNNFLLGALFAAMTLATGDIWAAVGAHWVWNVVWGPVLGFAADGIRARGLWQAQYTAATAWNGGPLGPQSGAVVFGVALVWLAAWVTRACLHRRDMAE